MTWRPIETAPKDAPFLAAVRVSNNRTGTTYWEQHVLLLDDETGSIHPEFQQGWELSDYSHWQPLPEPPQ